MTSIELSPTPFASPEDSSGPRSSITSADDAPALTLRFPHAQRSLGWTLLGGGHRVLRHVVVLQVRDADLPLGVDPADLARRRLAQLGEREAAVFLTSAPVASFGLARLRSGQVQGGALATVGLGNAMRIGHPPGGVHAEATATHDTSDASPPTPRVGTINVVCWVDSPLTFNAHLEAISVCTQARTSVLHDAEIDTPFGHATGTGTDCIAVLCPYASSATAQPFAGLHTHVGHVIGASVSAAVEQSLRHALQRRAGRRSTGQPRRGELA